MSESPRLYPPRPRDSVRVAETRDLAAELNEAQAAAATHGDGPLLIIAGAGTGKTRTLVYRVAHLIERGAPPRRCSGASSGWSGRRGSRSTAGPFTPPRTASSAASGVRPASRPTSRSWTRGTPRI